ATASGSAYLPSGKYAAYRTNSEKNECYQRPHLFVRQAPTYWKKYWKPGQSAASARIQRSWPAASATPLWPYPDQTWHQVRNPEYAARFWHRSVLHTPAPTAHKTVWAQRPSPHLAGSVIAIT